MARPLLAADLRRAGPLSDPVRFFARVLIINTIAMSTLLALAMMPLVAAETTSATGMVAAGLLVEAGMLVCFGMTPFAMWLLLAPRRELVFYLRAFRSDAQAAPVRRLIKAALGTRYRLCGIRPPRERVSWLSRLFLNGATGFRYLGTEQFELEANDHNWMPRLLASYARARFVVIDVRDVTIHVAHEIALSYAAMGPDRCVFLTDARQPEATWRAHIAGFLEDASLLPEALCLLRYDGDSEEQSRTFVQTAAALFTRMPQGSPDVTRAVALAHARVPAEKWPTPLLERDWLQALVGALVLNGLWMASYEISGLPAFVIGLVTLLFFVRALVRTWREARLQARFHSIVGGRNPLGQPRLVAGLSAAGLLLGAAPIAALAVPAFVRARASAEEISALSTMTIIYMAEMEYSTSCGGYAPNLTTLGAPAGGGGAILPPTLSGSDAPERNGYRFALHAGAGAAPGSPDCNGKPTVTAWYATATPLKPGSTGLRAFATDADGTIWQQSNGVPPTPPFGPPAVPVQ